MPYRQWSQLFRARRMLGTETSRLRETFNAEELWLIKSKPNILDSQRCDGRGTICVRFFASVSWYGARFLLFCIVVYRVLLQCFSEESYGRTGRQVLLGLATRHSIGTKKLISFFTGSFENGNCVWCPRGLTTLQLQCGEQLNGSSNAGERSCRTVFGGGCCHEQVSPYSETTIIYDTVPRRVTPLHSLEIIYFVRIHVHYLMPFKGSTQTVMQFDPRWHCNASPLGQK